MSDTKQTVDIKNLAEEISSENLETLIEKPDVYRPTPTPFPDSQAYEAK